MELYRSDPIILRRIGLADHGDSPLHIACLYGHFNFVKELLKLRKEFAFVGELNQNGFSSLHIAAANGDLQIVKEILKVDIGLCLVKGRERRIPLHYATIKGRIDVIKDLLSASFDSIEVVTSRGETALHLAVKNNQFEALEVLIKHINIFKKTEIFNKQDELGNTVLHLAVARKQHEVIDLMLSGSLAASLAVGGAINSLNQMGFTPLDVFTLSQSEACDRETENILRRAGGLKASEMRGTMQSIPVQYNQICASNIQHGEVMSGGKLKTGWVVDFLKYDSNRDSVQEAKEVMLIIMMLIAMVTFQAALNPPGILQQNMQDSSSSSSKIVDAEGNIVNYLIRYTSHIFLFFNSLGFFISLHMFHILTRAFPLRLELISSVISLGITYISCLMIKMPIYFCFYICMAVPFLLVLAVSLSRLGELHPKKTTTAVNHSLVNPA